MFLRVKILVHRHFNRNYFLKQFVLFFILISSPVLPGPLQEHRAASHQGGPFKLQTCSSSLYSSLLLSGHHREVHHTSGECFAMLCSSYLRIKSDLEKSLTSHALALCGLLNIIVFANCTVSEIEKLPREFL